jgi:hypothetical protein
MPIVPPLPNKPADLTAPPSDVKPDAETGSVPASDASAAPLSLAPASRLGTTPGADKAPAEASPASGTSQDQ